MNIVAGPEQRADDRDVDDAGELRELMLLVLLQETADGELAAGGDLDSGLGAALGDSTAGRRLRHVGVDDQVDVAGRLHGRREVELDAVFLEGGDDMAVAIGRTKRKHTTGEEHGRLT